MPNRGFASSEPLATGVAVANDLVHLRAQFKDLEMNDMKVTWKMFSEGEIHNLRENKNTEQTKSSLNYYTTNND